MKRSKLLLIGVIISVFWMIFSTKTYFNFVDSGMQGSDGTAIGTAVGAAMLMPYMTLGWLGAILGVFGWLCRICSLVLASAILMTIAFVLGITWGFGLIPAFIICYIAYSKMKKTE